MISAIAVPYSLQMLSVQKPARGLAPDQLVADGRIPLGPVVAAPDPHRLRRVVVAVEVVAVPAAELDLARVLPEVGDAVADLLRIVLARALQGDHARGRPRETHWRRPESM